LLIEAWDYLSDQRCGCQDVAREYIRKEYHLEDNPTATYHDVWREWITHKLFDGADISARDLSRTYARDLAVTQPGLPASKLGFREWMEAQTWDLVWMVAILNQILDDPDELPA
jgi:hypothetical protein